ncbi:MAG: gliding motility lipoprotein GldB [Cytophagales bacterium]|nr:gliding motility lipoprotein GldB [Cytophagales bacterium]
MKRSLALVALFVVGSCSEREEPCTNVADISAMERTLKFESLEDSLPAMSTKKQLVDFMSAHPDTRDIFFNRGAYPGDSAFINQLFLRFTNPHIDTLLQETHRVFGDGQWLAREFQQTFANLRHYYPSFPLPRIQTNISGLENDLYVTDSIVFIGLDYFLGPGSKFRPNNMYEYMLRRYTRDFVVPSVVLLIGVDSRINKINSEDRTALAEMIAYGKAYYFAKKILPCTPDHVLMGYTQEELAGSQKWENLIWSRLIQDQVLYSTSHLIKQKYLAERPKTIEVGEECPGRIAQWVGWRIVEKYMQSHPEITLPALMESRDAQLLFRESGYKPQLVKVPSREKT